MKKILVIEDDYNTRNSLVRALGRNGYQVFEVADGVAGLEMAHRQHPDIVLSDVVMPGINGFVVLKELHACPDTAAIPVVLMTGQSDQADARDSMDLGADDFLRKPFTIEQMLATLSARLERQDLIQRALQETTRAERISAAEKIRLQTTALDAAANGMVITDKNGTILWVNPAFTRLTGFTAVEAIGKHTRLLRSGSHSRQFYENLWHVISAGFVWRGEIINKRKDGSLYDEEMTITPVRGEDGLIQNYIAIKQDVSELKKIEQALAYKRDLLQALLDNLPDYIYFKDANCNFTRINLAYARCLGLETPEKAIGKCDADFLPLREARQKLVDERRLLATGEPILGLVEKADAAGQCHWVSSTKVPIHDPHGAIAGMVGISRDITKIKLAEEELQRKSALLEAQVNSSIDGILVVDEKGRKILQNQRFNEMLCIPQAIIENVNDEEQLSWVARQMANPETFLEKVRFLNSRLYEVSRDEIELKNGTVCDRYSAPLVGRNGAYFGRLWTFRDITGRKRTEEKLRESEEKFHGFLKNFRDAVLTLDPATGRFTSANPAAIKMFGAKDEQELLSLSPVVLSPERQPGGGLSADIVEQKNLGHGLQNFEWTHRRLSGEEFFAEVLLTRMEAGGKPLILSTVRDITSRKQAREKLRESEEKFRQLANNVSDVFWITSPDLRQIHYVNPAYCHIWGRSKASLETSPSQWPLAVIPEDHERVLTSFHSLLSGATEVSAEYRIARPDGATRWIHDRGFQVRDAAGQAVRLAGIASDITERKRLETELFHARKLESIGQLAAGIAHEINTPTQYVGDNTRFVKDSFSAVAKVLESHEALLAAAKAGTITSGLIASCEALLAGSDLDYLRSQIPQALTETLDGVDRVTKIVRAMREFSHPGGREKSPADLNQAIESTVTVARNEWKYVADLKLDLDPMLPFVPCFLGEFNQIVLNLVVNAAHAIGDHVKVNPGSKGVITVQTRREDDYARVCVADNGTGIAEINQPKIFEPFFTTKAIGQGTGQGLAMVYGSVVNRHGGTVTFETKTGRGTTFIVRLPLKPKPDATPSQPEISRQ